MDAQKREDEEGGGRWPGRGPPPPPPPGPWAGGGEWARPLLRVWADRGVGSLPPHYEETENQGVGCVGGGGGRLPPGPGDPTPSSPLPQERGRERWGKPEGGLQGGTGKPGADLPPAPDPTLHLPVTASLTGDGGELLN